MYTLNCKQRLLVADRPLVMGIINATPDSFYTGSRHLAVDDMVRQAEKLLQEGADILDIGGQSTRPGSEAITAVEELSRVIPGIKKIVALFPESFISIDTYYAKVAQEAVAAGACIINDISAGSMDPAMIETVASLQVPYILTHMQGTPRSMQLDPRYTDVTKEVLDFFIKKIDMLHQAGVVDIIIDPGFGFGKTIAHNFELLKNLGLFTITGCPVLAGISRKGTIWKTLGITAEESLNGTTVLNTIALLNGASILRVHDVKEAMETIKLISAYKK